MQQQRLHKLLVQQVTRAVPVAVRVARHPLLERHGALHVGRLVLNMSKYLIRLPNTSAKDHQRARAAAAFLFVLLLAARCGISFRPLAVASNARTGVGAALDRESAALAISSIMGLPPSNMP